MFIPLIQKIVIEEGVESIGANAFINYTSLTSIKFPVNSLKRIGNKSFWGCTSLKELDLPKTVEWIDDYAFTNSGLTSVICRNEDPANIRTTTYALHGINNECTLLVPNVSSVSRYKNAAGWNQFKNIKPSSITTPPPPKIESPPKPTVSQVDDPTPRPLSGGRYFVSVGSAYNKTKAEDIGNKLPNDLKNNFEVIEGKGGIFRVSVYRSNDRKMAQNKCDELKKLNVIIATSWVCDSVTQ